MDVDRIIAEFLTGPDVAHHSIGLQLPSKHTYASAERFFKVRSALGINGYMDADEAVKAIARARATTERKA